jgi:hypothetical protein
MEGMNFIARAQLLNLPEIKRRRPIWTDRLPLLPDPPTPSMKTLIRRRWYHHLPASIIDAYMLWLARASYRRTIEQIEFDELDEVVDADERCEEIGPVYLKHEARRTQARFLVATRERRRLERLARRWDVDAPKMIDRGEANEAAIAQVRRGIREARWIFIERCAKTLIPVLSLLVALMALLINWARH